MDIQLKRGLLDVCVLAALRRADSYGYQIVKEIQPYIAISESTLYPILRRLEEAGQLTVYAIEHNGRLRKYYRITPSLNCLGQNPAVIFHSVFSFTTIKNFHKSYFQKLS